jgi:electron transfer flavoprotein beta subunit
VRIAVLIKPVPEAESRLRPSVDATRLDPEGVKFVLAGYDESAVEQALLLKEAVAGSTIRAIAFGPHRCEESLRAALALGVDQATFVEGPPDVSDDPLLAARALADTLARTPADLILVGKHAGDDEEGLVGPALGEILGVPDFGGVVDLRPEPGGTAVTFQRMTEGSAERWRTLLPCVIALQQAWNDPRTAKLPNILKSRKMPIERVGWTDLAARLGEGSRPSSSSEKFALPPPRKGARMIEYKTPEDAAAQLVKLLREEAKVFP